MRQNSNTRSINNSWTRILHQYGMVTKQESQSSLSTKILDQIQFSELKTVVLKTQNSKFPSIFEFCARIHLSKNSSFQLQQEKKRDERLSNRRRPIVACLESCSPIWITSFQLTFSEDEAAVWSNTYNFFIPYYQ